MTDSCKVLHIFGRMSYGGAEKRTLDLMRHIDRKRYHFHFCVLSGQSGELDKEIQHLGGSIHYIALSLAFPFKFLQLLRREQYDVVHSHIHYSSGLILWLSALANVPIRIAHFRNTSDGKPDTL